MGVCDETQTLSQIVSGEKRKVKPLFSLFVCESRWNVNEQPSTAETGVAMFPL
jgi:hypothetical protein